MSNTFSSGPAAFAVGDLVVAVRELRQDGTYPDPAIAVGEVLVPADVPGQVVDVGVYLNEHLVYAVAFGNGRLVGCLQRELAGLPVQRDPADAEPAAAAQVTTGGGGEGP